MNGEQGYLALLRKLIDDGDRREGRNGVTYSLFAEHLHFPSVGLWFPLLTTKRVPFRLVALELLWFLRGETNAKWLEDQGVEIWREWGDPVTRELGPIYGRQWRSWHVEYVEGSDEEIVIDQIAQVVESIRKDPYGRRHVVSAWNPSDIGQMALPPCHCLFQFHVDGADRLSCHLYQRSADIFLGVPFNIASYALLLHMMARVTGKRVGDLTISFGDVHLYENHMAQAVTQLHRGVRTPPSLRLAQDAPKEIDGWDLEHFQVERYDPWPAIKAPVSA